MADEKLLRRILAERYGIRTSAELLDAIKNMKKLDIGWATARYGYDNTGRESTRGRRSRQTA